MLFDVPKGKFGCLRNEGRKRWDNYDITQNKQHQKDQPTFFKLKTPYFPKLGSRFINKDSSSETQITETIYVILHPNYSV